MSPTSPNLYLIQVGHWGRLWPLLRAAAIALYEDGCLGIAKGAAYSGLLSFFPILTTLASILVQARAEDVSRTIARLLYDVVPPGSEDVVRMLFVVHGQRPKALLIGATALAFWAASGALAALFQFLLMKLGRPSFVPSRLMIYWGERAIEGTIPQDAGAQIRDGVKSVSTLGAPNESVWPYVVANFAEKPPALAYTNAKQDIITSYSRVPRDTTQMRGCLADGFPFVLGFTVYESFESQAVADSGVLNMPASGEKMLGGHAVLAVGYDDSRRAFAIRNSWGSDWGIKGYFWMPYEYLQSEHLSSDFWTLRSVGSSR